MILAYQHHLFSHRHASREYTRWAFLDFGIISKKGSIHSEHEGGESEVKSEHT